MSLKDLIADVNVNEICEHIETETLSEWMNAWQEAALSALRPVSREQVEKVWRGEWEEERFAGELEGWQHRECGRHSTEKSMWCPKCGKAMTDEAVEMVMERLEILYANIE